jgi:hypothetical protein
MGLLQLLKALFGQKYLNKIIGTRTNVVKPIKMDKSSPFRRYANSAYDDPEIIALIEKKIDEYGPYALNNKNPQELANFEDNAKRLLAVKNKQTGTTEGMKKSMEPKPEAEMFEFETKQKLDDKGIMTLKEDMGLPPDVAPDSPMGKILTNRNKINQTFKEMGKTAEDIGAKAYSADIEGKRRAAMRQILLRDSRIKLPREVEVSLEDMKDLGKNADPNMDPLVLFDKYYKRDNKKLEMLDSIIDESLNPVDAADNFLVKDDTIELLDDDLGKKLKDYDGDPDALADGGRPGFKSGGLSLLNLFGKQGTNAAKQIKRSIDNIFTTDDAKYDADVVVDEILEHLGIDRDTVNPNDLSDLYGKAYDALTKQRFNAKKLMESVNQKGKGTVKTADNIPQPTKTLKSIEETGTIDISDDDIAGEFEAFMRRNDPEGMKTIDAVVEKINSKKRTDNAEGGRIGFSTGSRKAGMVGFQKLRNLIRNLAKERGVEGSDILKLMNYKNMQPDIKSRFSKKDFDKFKLEVQKSKMEQLENFRDMFQSRVTFKEAIEKGKAMDDGGTGMSDIFRYLDEDFSKKSPVPRDINEDDVLMMDQLIKNQTVKDDPRKLNAQGGLNYLMGL